MNQLGQLQFQRPQPIRYQIEERLRGLIRSGEIKPGTKLPSTRELAHLWHADAKAVHQALVPLVREGLLSRHPRIGTFVQKRAERLTCVGVYAQAGMFHESAYLQAVQAALADELTRAGIEMDLWTDLRSSEERCRRPWLPLVHAVERREFQALIVPCAGIPILEWLQKLPVPIAVQSGLPTMPGRVNRDMKQFAELGLRALARQGCRSVGLIAPYATSTIRYGERPYGGFFEYFTDRSRDLGLAIKNEWMRVTRYEDDMRGRSQEQFGYEQFCALWARAARPQGLIVTPDTVARGVMLALQQQQVRVPQELKLVLDKNESIELFCPTPATFVVASERAVARALIAQVQKQFRGERCEPINVPYRLMAHRGNSPQQITKPQEGSQL